MGKGRPSGSFRGSDAGRDDTSFDWDRQNRRGTSRYLSSTSPPVLRRRGPWTRDPRRGNGVAVEGLDTPGVTLAPSTFARRVAHTRETKRHTGSPRATGETQCRGQAPRSGGDTSATTFLTDPHEPPRLPCRTPNCNSSPADRKRNLSPLNSPSPVAPLDPSPRRVSSIRDRPTGRPTTLRPPGTATP